jgi:ADP-ribose pyrophosphatase YjhB (NUDIX family)
VSTAAFRIGVGGHQDLGDEATYHFVAQQFHALLSATMQREQEVVLYSALAIGADQLFIQVALDAGIPVEAVLPCSEYERNYVSEEERNEYRRLLHSCRTYHQLPPQQCSGDAYLAAGQWIVDQSDLTILAWNGQPAQGRGGTGDMANYARSTGRPFVHLHTRQHTVKAYGETPSQRSFPLAPKRKFTGVERPDSLLLLPVSQGKKDQIVLLIEEYAPGAGTWQLKLPGGMVESTLADGGDEQAQKELRQTIGYRAGRLEKLISFYSDPGCTSQKVHVFVAQDLVWDPLELEEQKEIKVHTYLLKEALAATSVDYRFDPEAALALWFYAQKTLKIHL